MVGVVQSMVPVVFEEFGGSVTVMFQQGDCIWPPGMVVWLRGAWAGDQGWANVGREQAFQKRRQRQPNLAGKFPCNLPGAVNS